MSKSINNKFIMDDRDKKPLKPFQFNRLCFELMTLTLLIIAAYSQPSIILFNSSYYLPSQSNNTFIGVNQSQLNISNNGVMKFLRVDVKIQIINDNSTYVDAPFQTANILVKYWKNALNTQTTNVLTYSYQKLSSTKQFPTAIDSLDNARVDIEAIYNYQNQHSFLHVMGNQTSDTLFLLGVYRFTNKGLTETLGMSTINDTIKITVTVLKALQSNICPQICSSKTFCPTNPCFCSQQLYSGCNATRKKLTPNINDSPQTNSMGSINRGEIKYIQINPESNSKQWFSIELDFSLQSNSSLGGPKEDRIFILVYLQQRNQSGQTIPNIYNFDFIDSPSLNSVITSSGDHSQGSIIVNQPLRSQASNNHHPIQMTQKILLSNSQVLTCAIYYLNDTSNTTPNNDSLTIFMNTNFNNYQTQNAQSVLNLALIIGMVVLGIFVLILLICLLHFGVTKRFTFWDVFSNHVENSNRNSLASVRFSRDGSTQHRLLSLPTVSYDFLQYLVFKPLKYVYSINLQQNNTKITSNSIKKLPQHDEICSICLQQFINHSKVKYTYCGHILHSQCIDSWLQKQLSCPLCRQKLQPQDITEYEEKILQEIVQNSYYQGIIDQQALTIKTMYKKWRSNRNIIVINNTMQITEESFINNQKPAELDRTDMKLQSLNDEKDHQNVEQHKQIDVQANAQNPTVNLNNVFTNNELFSVKRFGKNYLFYRCIFLHLQIHKNFNHNSELNLYHSDLAVEKDRSLLCESKLERYSDNQNVKYSHRMVQNANQLQPQPYLVRNHHQNDQVQEQPKTIIKEQINKTSTNFPTQLGFTFNIDFLSPERQLTENKSEMYLDNNSISSQPPSKQKQEKSDPSQSHQRKKLKNRRNKRMTMRQEMIQLEREFQQSEQKQENQEVKVKFSDNQSIIKFDEEDYENARYVQAPISIVTGSKHDENKSQSSKNCAINKTQVLVFSHRKKSPQIGQQTLKTLPYSVCLNDNFPISYRKFSHAQQHQKPTLKLPVKQLNLENI